MKFYKGMPVIYVRNNPKEPAGSSKVFYTRIQEEFKDHQGLHEHELVHHNVTLLLTGLIAIPLGILTYYFEPYPFTSEWAKYVGSGVISILFSLGIVKSFYEISDKYKYWIEIKAYRKGLEYVPPDKWNAAARSFAKTLATKYDLDISEEKAYRDLIKPK